MPTLLDDEISSCDSNGRVKKLSLPNGVSREMTYESAGGAGANGGAGSNVDAGRVKKLSLPNGVSREMTYDAAGRTVTVTQILNGDATEVYSYSYDDVARVTEITCSVAGDETQSWHAQFTYDSAGRLSAENRSGTGAYSKNYTYDANDNRLSLSVAGRLEPTRLNFTTALNSTLIPVAGTWTVLAAGGSGSNDNLQAVCAGYEAAQATVSIPDGTAPYSVTLQPDVTPLLTGMSLNAGITFSATTNGGNVNTFFASVKFEKSATELTRILQIENTTTPAVPVPIVAQSAAVIYTQDTDVTLSVSYNSVTKTLSVSMGSEQTKLSLPLENFSGNVGLEVWRP